MSDADFTPLTFTELLPLIIHAECRQRQTKNGSLLASPPPPCPTCKTEPAEVVNASGPSLELRVGFRPCGHLFTADDQTVCRAWDAAVTIVDERENRPVARRVGPSWPDRNPSITAKLGQPPADDRLRDAEIAAAVAEHEARAYRNQVKALVREMQRMHEERDTDQPTRVIVLDGSEIPDEGATAEELRGLVDEARVWARHGYEIGQRHCGWTDAGVAPTWLTEGFPPHIGTCEHLKQAAELDTALSRVRATLDRYGSRPSWDGGLGNFYRALRADIDEAIGRGSDATGEAT